MYVCMYVSMTLTFPELRQQGVYSVHNLIHVMTDRIDIDQAPDKVGWGALVRYAAARSGQYFALEISKHLHIQLPCKAGLRKLEF